MQGTHPIDERFREALANALAEPPPELGTAILDQVRSRRRRAMAWRWRTLAALLLVGAVASIWWFLHTPKQVNLTAHEGMRAKAADPGPAPAAQHAQVGAAAEAPGAAPGATRRSVEEETVAQGGGGQSSQAAGQPEPSGSAPEKRSGNAYMERAAQADKPDVVTHAVPAAQVAHEQAATGAPPEAGAAETALADRLTLPRLAILMARPEAAPAQPLQSSRSWGPARRGAWWVGASITGQQGRYRWQSDAENLRRALTGAGRWQSGIALGVHMGRSWPSGWSVGAGLEADRQGQAYRFLDRRTEVRTETVTQLVTLNTQVFAATVDTIQSYAVRETKVEGAESRTRIRVPVEVAWHLGLGRWRMGPRVAVVAERAFVRSTASLDLEPATGMVRSRALAPEELEARYPLSIQGLLALDLGYCASDRARLILSPFTTRHLTAIGPASTAQASPERFGVRLLLQHRF